MSFFNRGNKSADVETTIPIYDIPQPVSPDTGSGSYGADQYSGYGSTINFDEEKTMPMTEEMTDDDVTVPPVQEDDGKTVGVYDNIISNAHLSMENEPNQPAVGWLVCIGGAPVGRDFRLFAGRNSIGRGTGNIIRIDDESVSRDTQAVVVFEPRSSRFFATPGTSTGLCYLNGEMVLSQTMLKKNDVLELGECKLMLIPCCDENFSWNSVSGK